MTLLAIDPGADTGWAFFSSERRLVSCGLAPIDPALYPQEVVIECEQLRGRREPNPNSILLMARNAGEWFGRYNGLARYIRVDDWKGSTPKDISHRRVFAKLDPFELKALVVGCVGISPRLRPFNEAVDVGLSKSDRRHNILDAIGIGLFGVGR